MLEGRRLVAITFLSQDGAATTIEAKPGESLMSQAKAWGVAGIDADCGGALVCGTCQVFIDEPWFSVLTPPSSAETSLVEYGLYPTDNARLSCQIVVSESIGGMIVAIPPAQK